MEYLLYGLEQGETRDYMESLLFVTTDIKLLDKAKEYVINKGYHSLRVATYKGEAPNFTNVLN
jgi:hypothetical protein